MQPSSTQLRHKLNLELRRRKNFFFWGGGRMNKMTEDRKQKTDKPIHVLSFLIKKGIQRMPGREVPSQWNWTP
jgi:hypothetical protein